MKLFCSFLPDIGYLRCFCFAILCLLLFTGTTACLKNLPDCKMNCTKVTFSGKATNLSTGDPIKNVQIEVYLFHGSTSLFDFQPDYLAASGYTKKDGTFSFSPDVNIGYFNVYATYVNAHVPDDFIDQPLIADESGFHKSSEPTSYVFYNVYDSAAFRNLNYGYYEPAKLQVHLHRTSAYAPGHMVDYDFNISGTRNGLSSALFESAGNKDTTLSLLTAANLYTVIAQKRLADDTTSVIYPKDSVRCTKNESNSIDIYY